MASSFPWRPFCVVAVACVMFFTHLGAGQLWDDDEPKNAACGREMLERGDWIVPTYNGELRPHKPVLLYWAMMLSYKLAGLSELGARLASALAGVGTVLLAYHTARLLFDRTTGLVAGFLLTSATLFAVLARFATPDSLLIFCSMAALFSFVWGVSQARGGNFSQAIHTGEITPVTDLRLPRLAFLGLYGAMGLAVLDKGPIGLLLPSMVIALYALLFDPCLQAKSESLRGSRWAQVWHGLRARLTLSRLVKTAHALSAISGLTLVAAIVLPWYVAVSVATEGEWLIGFLGTHNVNRFLHPMEGHSGTPLYYWVIVMAGFFPGSCFLPVALGSAVNHQRRQTPLSPSHGLLLAWIGGYIIFFSIAATKLPGYISPCFPALAIATGAWLVARARLETPSRLRLYLGTFALGGVGLVFVVGLTWLSYHLVEGRGDPFLGAVGIIPLVGSVAIFFLLRHESLFPSVACFTAVCLLFTFAAQTVTIPSLSQLQASPQLANRLAEIEVDPTNQPLQVATFHYTKPNLVYYLGRPVQGIVDDQAACEFLAASRAATLVTPRDVFERLRPQLPADAVVLAAQTKFLRPGHEVVIVGRKTLLASESTDVK